MKITKQKVQAVADLKAGYTLGHADVEILNELARIALASLEAEPAGWQVKKHGGNWVSIKNEDVDHYRFNEELPVREVYTAHPAPVSVPDELAGKSFNYIANKFQVSTSEAQWILVGWNACRAAMLQGAEPVQGWIPCSKRMPQKNERVIIFINFNSETVPPSIHDAQFTGSTFRRGNATVNVFPLEDGYGVTHWMPLPEAPNQGYINGKN